jgi:hypothetical protein
MLALLGAHYILHSSRVRVNKESYYREFVYLCMIYGVFNIVSLCKIKGIPSSIKSGETIFNLLTLFHYQTPPLIYWRMVLAAP